MINLDKFDDNQFTISYELLTLLRWLVEHDTGKLKKIIAKALRSGLKNEIKKTRSSNQLRSINDMQYNILEFFSLLESLLLELANEQVEQQAREKNLMPTLDQIDSNFYDDETVQCSLEKVTSTIEDNPHENPEELLFKELLKRWKPLKKNAIN